MVDRLTQPLETYTLQDLLSYYNDICHELGQSGRGSVWPNKVAAVKAVQGKLLTLDTEPEVSPGRARLLASGQADALREQVLADQAAASAVAARRTVPEAPVADTPPVAPRGRASAISGDQIITVLAPENPKRPGSSAHAHFAKYRSGQTVDEYAAAIRSFRQAIRNIRWDTSKGFIRLS